MSGSFTPRAARALAPRIAQLARQIVDQVVERGECDLVADVAGELPSYVIAELIGIPLDDGRKLYGLTETMHSAPESLPRGRAGGGGAGDVHLRRGCRGGEAQEARRRPRQPSCSPPRSTAGA